MSSAEKSKMVHESVQDYYGKVIQSAKDIKTDCCELNLSGVPAFVKDALGSVHEKVKERYYGCGLVIPFGLEGMKILDLGCGSGHDCFALSRLVGKHGHVTGIDMTDEQLAVAGEYVGYHAEKNGYGKPNTTFVKGYLEHLPDAGLQENFYDIVVSNCVVNLTPDKKAVLAGAHQVLKEGGEFYFSDVYADRELPEELRKHQVLWGECIGGALWWKRLYKIAEEVGFSPPRLISAKHLAISEELQNVIGDACFVSVKYRLFKLPKQDGSVPSSVIYEGTIKGCEESFALDHKNRFPKGDPVAVSGEVAAILKSSRFSADFTFPAKSVKSCCGVTDEAMTDPFEYMERMAAPSGEGSCCATSAGGGATCCETGAGSAASGK